jgi:Dullard-like phosphatase family protein
MIIQNLFFILKNYKTLRNDCLINFLNNIRDQTYEQINIFFREYILRTSNLNGSILASVYLRNNTKFNTLPAPYVRTKNNKEFSLVLDLDETLVHFKDKLDVEGSGVLRIRPGVNEFLDEVGKYYELILFTTATQDYADLLIDAIEEDKIYFDHRLYREHAVIIDNDFVKDLNRIGRPLDKIIIVDNMPQNFKLQKENGIMIKPFWGEDSYDTALYELITILVNIAKEGGDIRIGLEKYKDDILKKVSSCISMENI